VDGVDGVGNGTLAGSTCIGDGGWATSAGDGGWATSTGAGGWATSTGAGAGAAGVRVKENFEGPGL
jgi:hypothetical protein